MPRFKNPHAPDSTMAGRGAGLWSRAAAFSCAGLAVLAIAGCAQLPGNAEDAPPGFPDRGGLGPGGRKAGRGRCEGHEPVCPPR